MNKIGEQVNKNRIMTSCLTTVAESLLEKRMGYYLLFLAFGTWGDSLAGVRFKITVPKTPFQSRRLERLFHPKDKQERPNTS